MFVYIKLVLFAIVVFSLFSCGREIQRVTSVEDSTRDPSKLSSPDLEIIWQDNFNGFISGWVPSVSSTSGLYPWTTDETYNPEDPSDDGGGAGITNYEPSVYPANQRTNGNSWNGWVQHATGAGTVSIQPTGGVDNSPVFRMRLIKYNGLSHEIGIHKWLGNTYYKDVYVQYKIRFGTNAGDWWWNGSWDGDGNPVGPYNEGGIIWKIGRAWTGFNPTDYDKSMGQTQPVENTIWSDESNWRTGIWIPGIWADRYNLVKNTSFFIIGNFHWGPSCPDVVGGTCDSQNTPRESNMFWEWKRYYDNLVPTTSYGMIHNFTNSGNGFTSTGAFTENQIFHTIEMRFKNRSNPSISDGAYQMWIDGVEITNDTAMSSKPIQASMSANSNDYGINFIRFGDNFNQLTQNIPDNPGYMDVFIDDIVISTAPIGIQRK